MKEECTQYARGVHTVWKRSAHSMKEEYTQYERECTHYARGVHTVYKRSAHYKRGVHTV